MKPDLSLKTAQLRRRWIPYFVLLVTLLLTQLATHYVAKTTEDKDRLRFENAIQRIKDDIQERLDTYVTLLRAGSGLFAANERTSRDDFRAFVNRLELKRQYPGIQGIGFSVRVMPDEKDVLVADIRQQGGQNFTIRPGFKRAEYHSIVYLEPLARRNKVAIGFDMFTEPVRRAAMERARDTGSAAASGRVTLVQEIDEHKQAGFLIYVPVYRDGLTLNTVASRRAALRGFIYSPFRADDLLEGILGTEKDLYVDFHVYDGRKLSPENLLHRSNGNRNRSSYRPRFTTTTTIDVAGRTWGITFASLPDFDRVSQRSLVPYIWLGGLLIGLVLFGLTRSQARAREAAEHSAAAALSSEKALRENEERFRQLAEKVRVIPWEAQAITCKFFYIGPQAVEILGYPVSDWYADNFWAEHVHPEDREWASQYCRDSSISIDNYEFEYRILTADGRVVWVYDIVNVVRGEDEPQLLRGFMIDISDRKRAEEEREQLLACEQAARAEAEAANRMKDEFLATLSHELRTPLNSMLGWMQLLRTRKFDKTTTDRALETINRNTKSLAHLIEDVLDVSRIITGKLHLNVQPMELAPLISAAIETQLPAAEAKEIQIESVLDPSVGKILGDAHRLQQVVWNLVSNAVKFTPKGGRVEVRLKRINSHAELRVSDTGEGIDPDFLPYVFDRFRQADSSTTRSHGGLGLGLAIVRHLVELHGGTVHAQSPGVGQGATLTVKLPLFQGSRERTPWSREVGEAQGIVHQYYVDLYSSLSQSI